MARRDTLAPGFRFHPTDEELIRYYLKRKVTNKPFRFDPISVVDIYKTEPWDLPGMAKLKSRDLEWYFFSALDKKYSNGSKTNRATEKGYWKTTGKDRAVRGGARTVGMKKTLVFHVGRAPRGERTNWVMHEYRLCDEELEKAGILQDAYVLCRIFQKSGTGPKNGEQYGAPFVEEEWDDEEEDVDAACLPCVDIAVPADEMTVAEDAYVETNDFDQNLEYTSECPDLPSSFYYGETSNHEAQFVNSNEDEQKPMVGEGDSQYVSELPDGKNNIDVPGKYDIDSNPVANHYFGESSLNLDVDGVNFLLDEPFLDATYNPAFDEGLFLEANDLSNPVEADSARGEGFENFEEYLNFFDAMDENLTFHPSDLLGSEDSSNDEAQLSQKVISEGSGEVLTESPQQPEQIGDSDASTSELKPSTMKYESDMGVKYPFLKQASHMLGGIHAPPSLASEFPIKDAALRLNAAQASSPVRVTAGLIRIENMILGGNGMDWSFGKDGTVNIILSFGLPQANYSGSNTLMMPRTIYLSSKTGSIVGRSWWLLLMFFWILILSVSCKIGSRLCGKLSGQ